MNVNFDEIAIGLVIVLKAFNLICEEAKFDENLSLNTLFLKIH